MKIVRKESIISRILAAKKEAQMGRALPIEKIIFTKREVDQLLKEVPMYDVCGAEYSAPYILGIPFEVDPFAD